MHEGRPLAVTARAGARCVVLVIYVAGLNAASGTSQHWNSPAAFIAKLTLFLLGSIAMLGGPQRRPRPRVAGPRVAAGFVGVLVVAGTLMSASAPHESFRITFASLVIAAAYVEEVVFRSWLPDRLERDLGVSLSPKAALTGAVVLAQCAFAFSHLRSVSGTAMLSEGQVIRLVVAGMALYSIVHNLGLWVAVALHALLNVSILSGSTGPWNPRLIEIVMCTLGGACALFSVGFPFSVFRSPSKGGRVHQPPAG